MHHPRLIAVALLILAGFSWWLAEEAWLGTEQLPGGQDATRVADYYVRGLEVTTMTPEGRPARRLRTGDLRHFQADATTELTDAKLTIFQNDKPPLEISAERGWVSADGELVLLQGAVAIERAAGPGTRPLKVVTRDLRVQPRQDYAETDARVRVTSLEDEVEAVGMQAWLREPARLKLLSQVRGHHVPR